MDNIEALKTKFREQVAKMTPDDFPYDDLRNIANLCGVPFVIKLLEGYSGIHVYIPKDGLKTVVERFVVSTFDGSNAKKIAIACGISEVHVYEIIRKKDSEKSANRARAAQLDLFELSQSKKP